MTSAGRPRRGGSPAFVMRSRGGDVLVQREEHASTACRRGRRAGRRSPRSTAPSRRRQLLEPGRVEPQAEPRGQRPSLGSTSATSSRNVSMRIRLMPGPPGVRHDLPGGAVRHLARPAGAAPDRLGRQEAAVDERADVVQDGRGVAVEPVGDLPVGQRLVEAEPQDPHAQRCSPGRARRRRRRRVSRRGRARVMGRSSHSD